MGNLGSLAAEDALHSSVSFVAAFRWLFAGFSQTLPSALARTPSAVYDSHMIKFLDTSLGQAQH